MSNKITSVLLFLCCRRCLCSSTNVAHRPTKSLGEPPRQSLQESQPNLFCVGQGLSVRQTLGDQRARLALWTTWCGQRIRGLVFPRELRQSYLPVRGESQSSCWPGGGSTLGTCSPAQNTNIARRGEGIRTNNARRKARIGPGENFPSFEVR